LFGNSRTFVEAVKLVKKFARCDAPVLIEGETGTGKELAARAIHYLSARRDNPFIPVNCGAIPDDLLENELFGHERGAFTDAKDVQLGLVAQASGGTLFLDELDTLSVKAQVTLLRFLDDQEYKPLGGKSLQKADARVVAATNANLEELAQKGRFRRDLLFRLNVLSVHLPALRERADDIRLLAEHFIGEYSTRCNQSPKLLHPESLAWMRHYHWPGNVRELENLLQRELLLSDEPVIWIADKTVGAGTARKSTDGDKKLYSETSFREAKAHTIAAFEKCYLRWLMTETRGNISLAAKRAGKERSALRKLLQKHGIQRTTWSVTS
jgi:DNA-binding NtrC family response regulator